MYADGRVKKAGRLKPAADWAVTRKLSLAQGRFRVRRGESALVQLRFAVTAGTARLDDVYVDPRSGARETDSKRPSRGLAAAALKVGSSGLRSRRSSLSLPAGASALSPPICVEKDYPSWRFAATSGGGKLGVYIDPPVDGGEVRAAT